MATLSCRPHHLDSVLISSRSSFKARKGPLKGQQVQPRGGELSLRSIAQGAGAVPGKPNMVPKCRHTMPSTWEVYRSDAEGQRVPGPSGIRWRWEKYDAAAGADNYALAGNPTNGNFVSARVEVTSHELGPDGVEVVVVKTAIKTWPLFPPL